MENNDIDMMAEARNAQWSAQAFLGSGSIRVIAPAKANLFLAVGNRLPNGYHEVDTIMHALTLHDTVHVNCLPWEDDEESSSAIAGAEGNLQVSITLSDRTSGLGRLCEPMQIPTEQNLAYKAIDALAKKIGWDAKQTIKVHIEKNIPSQAGLGGGSADAAAALVALAQFWNIPDTSKVIVDAANEIGSDVAFFLQGGCGLYAGSGERFCHSLEPMTESVILIKPPIGVATAQAYAMFDEHPEAVPDDLLAQAQHARSASQAPLFNNLAAAAFRIAPELASVQEWLADELSTMHNGPDGICGTPSEQPSRSVHEPNSLLDSCASERGPLMTGSGSAIFAIADSFAQASRLAAAAQARGWWARATAFSKLRAVAVEAKR